MACFGPANGQTDDTTPARGASGNPPGAADAAAARSVAREAAIAFQTNMTFRADIEGFIPHLRRYARALTRDRDLADDLVQDTLVKALAAEWSWRGGDLRVWLFTILTNVNRNRLRGLARRATHHGLDVLDHERSTPPTTGEGQDIAQALDALSVDQREALLLVALEGMSYAACAQTLGIPVGTVMSRLARAREAMRAALERPKPGAPHLRIVK
jgi:RNA polymerase sigma-70 factor (ECF subfamily)